MGGTGAGAPETAAPRRAAEEVKSHGTFAYAADAIPDAEISRLMSQEKREDRLWDSAPASNARAVMAARAMLAAIAG